jgi:hypothetical protein
MVSDIPAGDGKLITFFYSALPPPPSRAVSVYYEDLNQSSLHLLVTHLKTNILPSSGIKHGLLSMTALGSGNSAQKLVRKFKISTLEPIHCNPFLVR